MGEPAAHDTAHAWTIAQLTEVVRLKKTYAMQADQLARVLGKSMDEVDRASWALLGQTPCQAFEQLRREDKAAADNACDQAQRLIDIAVRSGA